MDERPVSSDFAAFPGLFSYEDGRVFRDYAFAGRQ